jgi:hypothetical protein
MATSKQSRKRAIRRARRNRSRSLQQESSPDHKDNDEARNPSLAKSPYIVSEIPWGRLKRSDLEECIFWLLDAMGAKELTWRRGGSGHGTSDQGRDLECLFYAIGPDGEMQRQHWWIEAKGRNGTVEPSAVKESVVNASAYERISTLVIATNTQFSNPTVDWVRQWSDHNPGLRVRLWDRDQLERLICRHPEVIFRLFSEILSIPGHAEVSRARFLNRSERASEKELRVLWENARQIRWSEELFLAVLVAEVENGDLGIRPWGMVASNEKILATLGFALVNTLFFVVRRTRPMDEQHPYLSAVSYLMIMALTILSPEGLATYCWDVMADMARFRHATIKPIIGTMLDEVLDGCARDCERILYCGSREEQEWRLVQRSRYWDRFLTPRTQKNDEKVPDPVTLIISEHAKPCKLAFPMRAGEMCPIADCQIEEGSKGEMIRAFEIVAAVIQRRLAIHS